MKRFQPGQQVVCIKRGDWNNTSLGPHYNEIVTVAGYHSDGSNFITIKEYRYDPMDGKPQTFAEQCFEPLCEITELTEILERQTI